MVLPASFSAEAAQPERGGAVRYGRHHLIVLILAWAIILLMVAYGLGETRRIEMAEQRQMNESLERGLELYARNCSSCHGPQGEGCVGSPLNRPDFRGAPQKNKNVADMLRQTIIKGRAGTGLPKWVKAPDGQWASYTQMPAWHRDNGGPLNDMHINDLVNFIMLGDFSKVFAKVKEIEGKTESAIRAAGGDPLKLPMRDAPGLSKAQNEEAQRIFTQKGCTGCHKIGSRGSSVAADLSFVGEWGLDREFLKNWIKNPAQTKNRTPVYFTNYGPELDIKSKKPVPLGPTVMPGIPMTDAELEKLVDYLLALKVEK